MGYEIDSKMIIKKWEDEIRDRLDKITKLSYYPLIFVIVTVGESSESRLYVKNKVKKARELGIQSEVFSLPETVTQKELNKVLNEMVYPTILQLPLPPHLDHHEALEHLDYTLDLDGLTNTQAGMLAKCDPRALEPATAKGVIRILEDLVVLEKMKVAILSRSELIGIPLSHMLLQRDAYPVIMHSKILPIELGREIRTADIVVTGCGKRAIFTAENFNQSGQVIIDCSMTRVRNIPGVGDVNKEDVIKNTMNLIASGFGHTGPATVMGLMDNIVKYYEMITEDFK